MKYRVKVTVKEVRGYCAASYEVGDTFEVEWFYVKPMQGLRICLHALNSMMSLLLPFLKGVPAEVLGIGKGDVGYVQCPDPGAPYTEGGTVVFELRREKLS